jgi:type IV pilus assembly protein PilQ
VIFSPTLTGTVTLQLTDADADDVFHVLLASQGLAQWQRGNVFYVAPLTEMIEKEQNVFKLKEIKDAHATLTDHWWQIRFAKAEDIAKFLQDNASSLLSKSAHVRVDNRTNQLYIAELAERLPALSQWIEKLDVPLKQILIEARLANVDSDMERELGVNFTAEAKDSTDHGSAFSVALAKLADGHLLDVSLSAMEKSGKGELISNPRLFTANQETASIESGEEIPYQEVGASGGTGVTFKKAVLSLHVTPEIMPNNQVLLKLQINQDRPSNRIVLGVPAITTRQMTTNVVIKNGQTLVLGGIYELNKEHDFTRIPFLGEIPLVGFLFQRHNTKENKRELLIFITPKIIA